MAKVYDNPVFTTMMYSSQIPVGEGEEHCPRCMGYGIRPKDVERGERSSLHETCDWCNGKAKRKKM